MQFVFPKVIDGCANALTECTFECSTFILRGTFSVFRSLVPCIPAMLSVKSVPWACSFSCTLWSMNETVDPLPRKVYVFSLLPPLCIESGAIWRKLVTLLLWLIVAALTLTAWLPSFIWFSEFSNRLCFLMHPLMPHALNLQSLIAYPLPRHP